jgi:hypothetical protein
MASNGVLQKKFREIGSGVMVPVRPVTHSEGLAALEGSRWRQAGMEEVRMIAETNPTVRALLRRNDRYVLTSEINQEHNCPVAVEIDPDGKSYPVGHAILPDYQGEMVLLPVASGLARAT